MSLANTTNIFINYRSIVLIMIDQTKEILSELRGIRADLDFIKTHIKDLDILLTEDDLKSIRDAERDFKEGKTKRLI